MIVVFLLLVIVASTWAVLAVAGLPVLIHLQPPQQRLVLPALPILGAMALVVVTHWPAAVLPAPAALGVTAGILLAVGVAGWVRGGRFEVTRKHFGTLVIALVLGAIPATLALLPAFDVDRPRLIQPTANNDAFAYVSVASWLRENPALDIPMPVEDPPVYGYANRHLEIGVRIGEEFLHLGAALVNGRDVASTWYAVLGVWVLMLPGAFWAAARVIGLRPAVGAVAGFVAGSSAVLISQVYNQNSAAVLGVAMAPLTVVAIARRLDGAVELPRWFAPLALAALAGTYTEFLPVLAPGFVVFVLARSVRNIPGVLARGAGTLLAAVVLSPYVWWNVVRSLLLESGLTAPGVQSSFIHAPGSAIFDRVVGATYLDGSSEGPLGLALAAIVAVGAAGALAVAPVRRIWFPMVAGAVAVIGYLTFVHRFPYGQQRAVQITVPLALFLAAVGFGALVERLGGLTQHLPRPVGIAAVSGLVTVGLVFPAANVASSLKWEQQFQTATRSIDAKLLEGVGWIEEIDRSGGAETMIISSNFFEQLWLTYELRDQEGTSYPFLYPDYMNVGRYDRWDGRLRRYALVGRDDYIDTDEGVVIRENARFRLLDLTKGEAIIATPSVNWSGGERNSNGVAHWMGDAGELLVLRTPGAPTEITLVGNALGDLDPLPMTVVTAESETVATTAVSGATHRLRVVLPDRPGVLLFLNNGKPAQRPSSGDDPRIISYYLTGVTRDGPL